MKISFFLSAVLASCVAAQQDLYCCSVNAAGQIVPRNGYTASCCGRNSLSGDGSFCTVFGNARPFENCCRGNKDKGIGVCS